MAVFNRFNGDAQPVFAMDISNGPQTGTITSDALVQMDGPKLDFFSLVANTALTTTTGAVGNVNGFINSTLQGIQQVSTVAMYQVGPLASANLLNVAVYPSGAYATTAAFLAAANVTFTGYQWNSCAANAAFTIMPAIASA